MLSINTINKISIIAGLFLAISVNIAVANPTKALLIFPVFYPVPPQNTAQTIYMYDCFTDSTCASPRQSSNYGYITNVPSFHGPGNATWVTLDTGGAHSYYKLWQNTGTPRSPVWQTCQLGILANGVVATDRTNTCVGPGKISSGSTAQVSQINMGVIKFPTPRSPIFPAPSPHKYNDMPTRTISFENTTSDTDICMSRDTLITHVLCSGYNVMRINANTRYVYSIAKNGENSRNAQVFGVKNTGNGPGTAWKKTGIVSYQHTNLLEWNMYPVEAMSRTTPLNKTDHSIGASTIDISLVNGFNTAVRLIPTEDIVCSVSKSEGGPSIFNLYPAGRPMASFPTSSLTKIKDICPLRFNAGQSGCFSQCALAHQKNLSQEQIDSNCCTGDYDTYATCNPVISHNYINAVTNHSQGVYAWAYNDYRGTFTCQADASFIYEVTQTKY
jgi:hypothetical protein